MFHYSETYLAPLPKRFLKPSKDKDDFEYTKSDELVEAVVTICNDEYILRVEENAFMMKDRPFVAYQHDIIPNRFWGRGVVEKGYNAQKALDVGVPVCDFFLPNDKRFYKPPI